MQEAPPSSRRLVAQPVPDAGLREQQPWPRGVWLELPPELRHNFKHMMDTTFFLGRETLLPTGRASMSRWRKTLFGWMSKNARPATAYFQLPPNRVVELGSQVEL